MAQCKLRGSPGRHTYQPEARKYTSSEKGPDEEDDESPADQSQGQGMREVGDPEDLISSTTGPGR